jgi:hypothetical protein
MPFDEQFESFRNLGLVGLALCEGADAGRVVHHEYRPRQLIFDLLLKNLVLDYVRVLAGRVEPDLVGIGSHGRCVTWVDPRVLRNNSS